jgi:LysM repeat protein
VTVRQIVGWNSIRNVNRIFIGQRLIVGKASGEQTFHRVETGDTVSLIAQLRGVPLARVMSLNPSLRQDSSLDIGALVRLS